MPEPIRGRGVGHNPANRFIPLNYEEDPARVDPDGPAPTTQFYHDHSKSLITTNNLCIMRARDHDSRTGFKRVTCAQLGERERG